MLCKSGGLVAFTASELGISDHAIHRDKHGVNVMKAAAQPAANGASEAAAAPAPQLSPPDPATAYYGLGAPKGAQPPKGN
jgi:hypothetical protein